MLVCDEKLFMKYEMEYSEKIMFKTNALTDTNGSLFKSFTYDALYLQTLNFLVYDQRSSWGKSADLLLKLRVT